MPFCGGIELTLMNAGGRHFNQPILNLIKVLIDQPVVKMSSYTVFVISQYHSLIQSYVYGKLIFIFTKHQSPVHEITYFAPIKRIMNYISLSIVSC